MPPPENPTQSHHTESNSPRCLILLATYNEIENIPQLVEAIFEHSPNSDLLVVDDNSPDGTGDWCDQQAKVDTRIHCLHRTGKLGLGTAIVAGMQYAIREQYNYLINLDADFSHPPKHIPLLIERMTSPSETDVMIGSRYVSGGGIQGWPFKRHLMSRGVNFLSRVLLTLPVKDCSGSFRCYRISELAKLDFNNIQARGYAFMEEALWHLKRQGCRFGEIPIVFVDREKGTSKINSKEVFAAIWALFKLGFKNWFTRAK